MSGTISSFLTSANRLQPETDRSPIQVLLVDDDEDYYILTRALLSDIEYQSYQLDWKTTYDDALAALQQTSYDVCLLDYQLNGRNGLEVLAAVRERGVRTPMIMLTGHGDPQVDQAALTAGAADYLFKARTDATLLERSIRYALDRAKAMDALRENETRIAALYEQEQARARELERAYADLRRAETLRDDLTDMIVHDLRGPLTAILANLQLVGKDFNSLPINKPARYLGNVRTAANRMIWMIDDLLNVSKLEAGEPRLTLKPIDLPAFLAEKQETYLAQLAEEDKTLAIHAPEKLPALMADVEMLGRVFDNLIGNALKYTNAGGHIDIAAEAYDDRTLIIRVSDDGEGLLPEDQTRIFEKFAQGATSNTRPSRHGTGLGLAFCRLAILAHGGTIMADGKPGHGAIFTLTLPLNR